MFILKCSRDNSFCKIDESEVIFNKDSPPKEGETVKFLWYRKEELGEIAMKSGKSKMNLYISTILLCLFRRFHVNIYEINKRYICA